MKDKSVKIIDVSVSDDMVEITGKTDFNVFSGTAPLLVHTFEGIEESLSKALVDLSGRFVSPEGKVFYTLDIGYSEMNSANADMVNRLYKLINYGKGRLVVNINFLNIPSIYHSTVGLTYRDKTIQTRLPNNLENPEVELSHYIPELLESAGGFELYLKTLDSKYLRDFFLFTINPNQTKLPDGLGSGWKKFISSLPLPKSNNKLVGLVDRLFSSDDTFNPEAQGVGHMSGKGYEITVAHVLGNYYVKGYIGAHRVVIGKVNEGIVCKSSILDQPKSTPETYDDSIHFSMEQREEFQSWILSL